MENQLERLELDIEEIEKNVCRLRDWTPEQRKIRLNQTNSLNPETIQQIIYESIQMAYDENFCKRTKINYVHPNTNLIQTAIIDYLLDK